jgi:cbb3-type cytochrome oxidase maturation protein
VNSAGPYIVGICAVGALIACVGFWWAGRSGQFRDSSEAKYLVFDEDDDPRRQAGRQV